MRYCQKGLQKDLLSRGPKGFTIGYIIKSAWNKIFPKGFTIGYIIKRALNEILPKGFTIGYIIKTFQEGLQ